MGDGLSLGRLCPNLCDPVGCSPPGSSVDGILQARILVGCHALLQGIFPDSGIKPASLHLLNWQACLSCSVGYNSPIFFDTPQSWGEKRLKKKRKKGSDKEVNHKRTEVPTGSFSPFVRWGNGLREVTGLLKTKLTQLVSRHARVKTQLLTRIFPLGHRDEYGLLFWTSRATRDLSGHLSPNCSFYRMDDWESAKSRQEQNRLMTTIIMLIFSSAAPKEFIPLSWAVSLKGCISY